MQLNNTRKWLIWQKQVKSVDGYPEPWVCLDLTNFLVQDATFVREAAYNLSLIYVLTNATPLADILYRRWLSIWLSCGFPGSSATGKFQPRMYIYSIQFINTGADLLSARNNLVVHEHLHTSTFAKPPILSVQSPNILDEIPYNIFHLPRSVIIRHDTGCHSLKSTKKSQSEVDR